MVNAIEVTFDEMDKFIDLAYDEHHALYIHGGIGIGKSMRTKAKAKLIAETKKKEFVEWNRLTKDKKIQYMEKVELRNKSFMFIDMRGTQMADGSDVKGIPKFSNEYVEWVLNMGFKYMSLERTDGLLFLDELNLATPIVQASLYQIINDRCIVETAINSDWGIIAAGNRTEDRGHNFDMAFPLRNRFDHIELLAPSLEYWQMHYAEPEGLVAMNPDLMAFLMYKRDYLYKVNTDANDFAYPTPRSVAWAFVRTNKQKRELPLEMEHKVIASSVGTNFAADYMAFVEVIRKLPIEEVLKKPELMANYHELKEQCAFTVAFLERFKKDKKDLEPIFNAGLYLPIEIGAFLFKSMKEINPVGFITKVSTLKKYPEFKKKFLDVIVG